MGWKRVSLPTPFRYMMGDLFTLSPYQDDEIIYSHTRQMIYEIEQIVREKYPSTQWCIVFHLTSTNRHHTN